MTNFKQKYKDYTLITGASAGIGKGFAEQLATKGLNLVLIARRADKLSELASNLEAKHNIKVKTLALDLLADNAISEITNATENLEVGLIVLNAAVEVHGDFTNNNLQSELDLVKLNVTRPLQLAHHFGNKMKQRKRGGIIFLSSTFGHQSVPYFANYAASKAYILSLGQALNYELKKFNVDVTVLSPGPTKTDMIASMTDVDFKKMPVTFQEVTPVVKTALNALGSKQAVIPGAWNNFMDIMGKFTTPRWILTNMYGFLVARAMK
ncbi:Probable short-chain type dehydrogenase [Flavobacterium indicum GPTSA100-9 = DSM 17447]|uniref:Probable short-chain type dehydrogenase n=1 Tax=Flavobacterium indicum (strain DSM 17447 / CIP 109464 / GPTSA100-9) TaxID=1094466 RepID=H8XTN5_FLAIG|nr:SDR family NAD(P)-dependent oxidoreductase [Flavobacterium indicum]CCG53615.1 Probable short-chain type dehydrogenase [Flavobacterium indicum GPTSA100-9 = DSM 17447]